MIWRDDWVTLLQPAGFELGWSRWTAWGKDKRGNTWQVAVIGPKQINTMWYNYGPTGELGHEHASVSCGWMTRERFRELFLEEE